MLERGLLELGLVERELAGADLAVQLVLDRVDLRRPRIRLRPEIARIGRMPAELEADQVVLLIVGAPSTDAVFTHLSHFQLVRVRGRRPDRLRPAANADRGLDVRLRDVGVEHAGRARWIGVIRRLRSGGVRPDDREGEESEGGCDDQGPQRHGLDGACAVRLPQGVQVRQGPAETVARLDNVLTTNQRGALTEAAIVKAAIELGIGVFRPLMDERYDLILDLRPRLLRVQCKTAVVRGEVVVVRCYSTRRSAAGFVKRTYSGEEVDAVASHA